MNISNEPDIQRKYARADRFAWSMMVGLLFTGFIGLQIAVRDEKMSLVLGGMCLIGLISRECYLMWIFQGTPPSTEGQTSRPHWRGHLFHIAIIMLVWLIPDISKGRLSAWSFVGAVVAGGGFALFHWWRQARTSARKRP